MPGAPLAAGQHLHPLQRLLHARGRQRVRVGERVQQHGGEVAVHHRHAVLRAATVRRFELGRGTAGRRGCARRTGRGRSSRAIAFQISSLIHAFWNAVPMKRGGSHPSAASAGFTKTTPKPKPQCTSASGSASCSRRDRGGHVLRGLRDPLLGDDPDARVGARLAEVADVATRRSATARRARRPSCARPCAISCAQKIGSSVIDPCGSANVHSPSQSSVPVDADRRHLEALLDLLARRHRVVGDGRTEHRQAALVDELAVRVDHRLDRALRAGPRPRGTRSPPAGRSCPASSPSSNTISNGRARSSRCACG